jgi:NAD(P)-dependent dehydrogenase (short-subunit alcohol dehydrogenase family)
LTAQLDSSDRLAGRVALITGAAGGICRAIALRFAREGAAVACVDLRQEAAEAVAAAVTAAGGQAVAIGADLGQDEGAAASVATAVATFGHVDILVTGAVYFPPQVRVDELSSTDVAMALAVNVGGIINISRHALPGMMARQRGVVIHIASQLGTVGKPGQALYCATKGAAVLFTKAMALDYAAHGIRVISLSPGGVATEQMAEQWGSMENAQLKWGKAKHPIGRLAEVEEIASAALFLASDEASFITGTDLLVDGGYTAL